MYWREVVASLYAWDLADEGVDHVLDVLQRETLTNSAYLVALMHHEKRPLTDFYYPHNPRRKVHWTEDSRAYWHWHAESFARSRIKPLASDDPELREVDRLQELITAARSRGMTVGAELSHTWVDKERTASEFLDCVQIDFEGRPFDQQICFNHPDVRDYGRALYTDIATHYDVDYVMTCVRGFNPGERGTSSRAAAAGDLGRLTSITRGGCFCDHCRRAAEARGIDWEAMTSRMRWMARGHDRFNSREAFEMELLWASSATAAEVLGEIPELYAFLRFRMDSITDFFAEMRQEVKSARPDIDLRLNHYAHNPELMGLDLVHVGEQMDSIRSSDYSEQYGDPARMEWKRAYLHNVRRAIGVDKYFLSAISPRPKATPELVKQGILISAQCGADALTIGHYDGAWMNCLRAIKDGLEEAGIEIRADAPVVAAGQSPSTDAST